MEQKLNELKVEMLRGIVDDRLGSEVLKNLDHHLEGFDEAKDKIDFIIGYVGNTTLVAFIGSKLPYYNIDYHMEYLPMKKLVVNMLDKWLLQLATEVLDNE